MEKERYAGNGSESPKPEARARLLREGEVSPYKLLLTLLLRENYTHSDHIDLRTKSPHTKINATVFLYRLITSGDKTFTDLTTLVNDPTNSLRPEVVRRFNRVIASLDVENACFLYELVHSVIDMTEPSQVIVLKKRVGKNSPFGKFLRLTLHSLQKMSYPQILHIYRQLCIYVKATMTSAPLGTKKNPVIVKEEKIEKPPEPSHSHSPMVLRTPPSRGTKLRTQMACPRSAKKSRLLKAEILSIVSPLAEMEIGAEVTVKDENVHVALPKVSLPKRGLDVFQKMLRTRVEQGKTGLGPYIFNQYLFEQRDHAGLLTSDQELAYGFWELEKAEKVRIARENAKSLRASWKQPEHVKIVVDNGMDDSDTRILSQSQSQGTPTKKRQTTPRKSPRKSSLSSENSSPLNFCIVGDNDPGYFISVESSKSFLDDLPVPSRTRSRTKQAKQLETSHSTTPTFSSSVQAPMKLERDESLELGGSKRWAEIKNWSRRLIENTIKNIASDLATVGTNQLTPAQISSFVEAVKHNPSSQVLLPQLYYLEYLNSIRIKDVTRSSEALRTSFDLRIKPNTSELNKGTPYAAYNFAVFYDFMGYKEDAHLFLREAFQSGHSAGDATCLHYCLNLWSTFHDLTYLEVISGKETDKSMLDLHSRNLVTSSIDAHTLGASPKQVLEILWQMSAEQDVVEVESFLLEAILTYVSVYGWYEMASFCCQFILQSNVKWPSRTYCFALCALAQNTLLNGDQKTADLILDHGRELFGCLAKPEGILFGLQEGIQLAVVSQLGYKLVHESVISTISSFDEIESIYWMAYNRMILNDYCSAGIFLKKLLERLGSRKSISHHDLKLRCLMLQAELECLCETPVQALKYLFDALDLAYLCHSDFYIALCHINISSIQNHLGLSNTPAKALHKDMRAILRSSCPYLDGRLNILNVKLRLTCMKAAANLADKTGALGQRPKRLKQKSEAENKEELEALLEVLEKTKEIYEMWGNEYRIKEVLNVKAQVFQVFGKSGKSSLVLQEVQKISSYLNWSMDTCLV